MGESVEEIVILSAIDRVRPWELLHDIDTELPALLNALRGCRRILEIGTWKGATAAALALAFPAAQVTTIDLPDPLQSTSNPQPASEVGSAIRALGLAERIEQLRMDSADLPRLADDGRTFHGIFVDGDHREAVVFRDLSNAARLLEPGGVIVAHDFTGPGERVRPPWTIEVYEAVQAFLRVSPEFELEPLAGWLVSLRRK